MGRALAGPGAPISGYGSDGKKYVEFEPTLPKDAAIARGCIQVPWEMYAPKKSLTAGIVYYLANVVCDPRLGDYAGTFGPESDPTPKADVQKYANDAFRMRREYADPPDGAIVFVMKYVRNDDFARYCLVPLEQESEAERVLAALEHLEVYMNDDAMVDTRRKEAKDEPENAPLADQKQMEQHVNFREYYKERLSALVEELGFEYDGNTAKRRAG